MSKSNKHPALAYLPNHVLIPPVQHPISMRGHQMASEGGGFRTGLPSALVAAVLEDSKLPPRTVPPPAELRCRAFYESKGKNKKVLFAFLVGLDPKETLGLWHEFSLDKPPFSSRRREFKPTAKVMQQEVLRRATLQNIQRMPRPSQWSTEKLVESLSERFHPNLSNEDIAFLKEACEELYSATIQRNDEESHQAEQVKSQKLPAKEGGWKDPKAVLRLYHTLADLRKLFVARRKGKPFIRGKDFWIAAAERYNDATWIPTTDKIPQLEDFEESFPLPLNMKQVTPNELSAFYVAIKPKLRGLVNEWNWSFQPTPLVEDTYGLVEQWDYAALMNRLESREDVENHLMYLWEFANEKKMLGSCMAKIPEEDNTEKSSNKEKKKEAKDPAVPRVPSLMVASADVEGKDASVSSSSEQIEKEEEDVIEEEQEEIEPTEEGKKGPLAANPEHFTASQELHLEHLKLHNSIENELLDLELKKMSAKSKHEKSMYKRFAKRKKASLEALRRHLNNSAVYAMRVAEGLNLPSTVPLVLGDSDSDEEIDNDSTEEASDEVDGALEEDDVEEESMGDTDEGSGNESEDSDTKTREPDKVASRGAGGSAKKARGKVASATKKAKTPSPAARGKKETKQEAPRRASRRQSQPNSLPTPGRRSSTRRSEEKPKKRRRTS